MCSSDLIEFDIEAEDGSVIPAGSFDVYDGGMMIRINAKKRNRRRTRTQKSSMIQMQHPIIIRRLRLWKPKTKSQRNLKRM